MQPEQQQVARAARGDEDAFQALWSAHRDAVYRFACWMLQDTVAAEDTVQECFLALIEHPARFDPSRACLRTFLLAIARNKCRSRWRELAPEVPLRHQELCQNPETLELLAADEAIAVLNTAVANLPALLREALFLFEYEGFTLEQAADVAGVSVETLKGRLHRGRERLKRELAWLAKEGF